MDELLRTNDLVLISFIEALFSEAGIPYLVADQAIASVDGSIGAFPRRILVERSALSRAKRLMAEAGLAYELKTDPPS